MNYQLKKYKESIVNYEEANSLLPNNRKILYNLALAYEKNGQYTEAIKNMSKAKELGSDKATDFLENN